MTTGSLRCRAAAAAAVILAGAIAAAGAGAIAAAGTATITCTNPASGATWQIVVDPEKATVDANPARFSPATISWRDAKDGGNYTLDRQSGDLVASVASSTGGYFRRGHCNMAGKR